MGEFERVRFEGAGGFSEVYLGRQEGLGRAVALKYLRRSVLRSDGGTREVLAHGPVDHHPNIVTVHAAVLDVEEPFIAMEWMEGGSLERFLGPGEVLGVADVVWVGCGAASALAAAHGAGVLHRDVKPGNLLLGNGNVKLADFGIAKVVDQGTATTTAQGFSGTYRYVAPEVIDGAAASVQSDLYSLGATLYRLLSGFGPHEREGDAGSVAELKRAALGEEIDWSRLPGDVPVEVASLLASLLAADPSQRPGSAQSVVDALAPFDPGGPVDSRLQVAVAAAPPPVDQAHFAAAETMAAATSQSESEAVSTLGRQWLRPAVAAAGAGVLIVMLVALTVWTPWDTGEPAANPPVGETATTATSDPQAPIGEASTPTSTQPTTTTAAPTTGESAIEVATSTTATITPLATTTSPPPTTAPRATTAPPPTATTAPPPTATTAPPPTATTAPPPTATTAPPPTATTAPTPPAAPSGLSITGGTVNLAFVDNSDNENGFYVYVDGSRYTTLGANVRTFSVSPPCEEVWSVWATAFNDAGESGATNTVKVSVACL